MKLIAKKSFFNRMKDNARQLWRFIKPPAKTAADKALFAARSIHIEPRPRRRALINFAKGLIPGAIAGTIISRRLRASRMRTSS